MMTWTVRRVLVGDKYCRDVLLENKAGEKGMDVTYLPTSGMVKFFSSFNYVAEIITTTFSAREFGWEKL